MLVEYLLMLLGVIILMLALRKWTISFSSISLIVGVLSLTISALLLNVSMEDEAYPLGALGFYLILVTILFLLWDNFISKRGTGSEFE